jgi:hypothetical protein
VIEELAASEADLREACRQLGDLVADLAFENHVLRLVCDRELLSRIHGDATIERLRRHQQRQRAT